MNSKTMTRMDLSELFAKQFFMSQSRASLIIEVILEELLRALSQEKELKVSSFGTFVVHQKSERLGRNPKTGKSAVITARKSLSFRPSVLLKQKVNRKNAML